MDKEFTFKYGRKQTGVRNGLLIHNQARCGVFFFAMEFLCFSTHLHLQILIDGKFSCQGFVLKFKKLQVTMKKLTVAVTMMMM